MREAKIICPFKDNDGKPVDHIVYGASKALINAFGGCTEFIAYGSWANDKDEIIHEPVTVLIVACNDTAETMDTLDAIADHIGYKAKQQCVYVQYPNGTVVLRDTSHFWAVS
jgi:hypothetical protein